MNEVTVKHIDDMPAGEHAGPEKLRDLTRELSLEGVEMRLMKLAPNDPEYPGPQDGKGEVFVVLQGYAVLHTPDGTADLDPSVVVRVGPTAQRRIVPGDVGATILAIAR